MNITIEGNTYVGEAFAKDRELSVMIEADISDAFAWNKEMIVDVDGAEYSVLGITTLVQNGVMLNVHWSIESEAVALEKQVEKMNKELAEDKSRFDAIREAIKSLGDGIPAITKLLAFLNAVKEAIHYGDGSNDED